MVGMLLETDLSYEEIADRLTLSKATVHRYYKKQNIQRPYNTGGRPQILTEASKSHYNNGNLSTIEVRC